MKCFIHFGEEAVAACRNCGKGMCTNCSAYSNHSGICPECRKKEFEQKVSALRQNKKDRIWTIVKWSFLAVFVITIPVSAIIITVQAFGIKKDNAEISSYMTEIEKLSNAMNRGNASI